MRQAHIPFGLIVPALLLAASLAQQPPSQQPKDYSFKIPAARPWTDTGIDLAPGQIVHVFGAVVSCGAPIPIDKDHLPLPSAPPGALLAKVHLDAPPVSASPDAEIPILDPSHLYLGVNGANCAGGTIPAKVHVEPPESEDQKK